MKNSALSLPNDLIWVTFTLTCKHYASTFTFKKLAWMGVSASLDPALLKRFRENSKFCE